MIKKILILLTCVLLFSCESENQEVIIPEGILPKQKMAVVIVEISMMDAYLNQRGLNSYEQREELAKHYKIIFDKHQILKDEFDKSFEFYSKHPDLLHEVYTEGLNEVSRRSVNQ